MYQPNWELNLAVQADHKARHRQRNEGIDCSVCYLEPKRLATLSGETIFTVRYALSDKAQGDAHLPSIRRGMGVKVLIHPLDARAWILHRAKLKEEQEKQNAEAA